MRCLSLIAAVCVTLGSSGCATKSVVVVDAKRAPIRGAKVEAITLSMNLAIRTTDASGIVSLPRSPQKIEWVSVKKDGFEPSGQVPVSPSGATTVVLLPAK